MGEQKSCLFCGKNVDESFEYCPHCGYEFEDDDRIPFGRDRSTLGGDKSTSAADCRGAGGDLPGLIGESTGECVPAAEEDYLHRLRTLQDILSDMERELDLIIRTSSKGP